MTSTERTLMSQVCGDYRISVIKHQRHSVKSRTFFSFSLDFSKNYGIIPACWLKSQRGTHPSMQVVSHRRGKPSLINHLAVFYACKMNMNNVAHKNLEFIRDTHKFITLKNLRKNSYEIFSKFCKTNPIFLSFSPENEDSAKKQTQSCPRLVLTLLFCRGSNPIQTQSNPILAQKSGGQSQFKPNLLIIKMNAFAWKRSFTMMVVNSTKVYPRLVLTCFPVGGGIYHPKGCQFLLIFALKKCTFACGRQFIF